MQSNKKIVNQLVITLVVLFGLTAITGCDRGYGVRRYAQINKMPDIEKINNIIKSTAGVDNVRYEYYEGGKTISIKGLQSGDKVYSFTYSGGQGVRGSVQFVIDDKNNVYYRQTLLDLHKNPNEIINVSRPIMIKIETKLEYEGGVDKLTSIVKEDMNN